MEQRGKPWCVPSSNLATPSLLRSRCIRSGKGNGLLSLGLSLFTLVGTLETSYDRRWARHTILAAENIEYRHLRLINWGGGGSCEEQSNGNPKTQHDADSACRLKDMIEWPRTSNHLKHLSMPRLEEKKNTFLNIYMVARSRPSPQPSLTLSNKNHRECAAQIYSIDFLSGKGDSTTARALRRLAAPHADETKNM